MRGSYTNPKAKKCLACNKEFLALRPQESYCSSHSGCNKSSVRWKRKLHSVLLARYGGCCLKCGFSDTRALQFDHVLGGGCKDRRDHGWNYWQVLFDIRDHPEKYQLLCANCNSIKRYDNREISF